MKKPQYKIGDYVEFKHDSGNKKGFIKMIYGYGQDISYCVKTRAGYEYFIIRNEIIRKLPILRDKNGRFVKMGTDCSCFNCDKCAEQMRAYYEKTGELKPKMGKNWGKIKDAEGNFHEFGEQKPYDEFGSRVYITDAAGNIPTINGDITYGNKKPSERISELFKKNRVTGSSDELAWCRAIGDYLDEQFEKGKK